MPAMLVDIHPGVRLLALMSLTIVLPWLSGVGLWSVVTLLAAIVAVGHATVAKPAWLMLKRLKWFWLALLLLYGWMLPSADVVNSVNGSLHNLLSANLANALAEIADHWLIPSWNGLLAGLQRALALAVLVVAVVIVQVWTSREKMLAGLLWLGWPLRVLGFNIRQAALRLVLTMEYAAAGRPKLVKAMSAHPANPVADQLYKPTLPASKTAKIVTKLQIRWRKFLSVIKRLANQTVQQFAVTEQQAATQAIQPVPMLELGFPNPLSIIFLLLGWSFLLLCVGWLPLQ